MQKTLLKKSMNLFLCGILSTAVLLGGCGIGNTANTQKEEQPAAAVQKPSLRRRGGRYGVG